MVASTMLKGGYPCILVGWRVARERRTGRHDLTGLTVSALRNFEIEPSLLDLPPGKCLRDRLDCHDLDDAILSTGVTHDRIGFPF